MEHEVELGIIGENVIAIYNSDETQKAITIDQIRSELGGIACELIEGKDISILNLAANVLSALEAEYINCFAEPTE